MDMLWEQGCASLEYRHGQSPRPDGFIAHMKRPVYVTDEHAGFLIFWPSTPYSVPFCRLCVPNPFAILRLAIIQGGRAVCSSYAKALTHFGNHNQSLR